MASEKAGVLLTVCIFVTDIRLAFSKNKSVLSAFLDIKGAYDNVVISILHKKLNLLHVPEKLTSFIIGMLSERYISINIQDGSQLSRFLWKGLPQGSVLSPILYNIYTFDLDKALNQSINILQYADDLLLYISDQSISSSCNSLTASLGLLKTWLDDNGLELSVPKSTVVLFSRKRTIPEINIIYDNIPMPVSTQCKFLGVVLDNKLTGLSHCEYIAAKCEQNINIMKCLTGVWWGAHPFSLRLIYNALVRSVIDYGSFLLEPCSTTALNRLDKIQSKALRIILGAMKTSPINAMQVECVDPPLHLRRQFLSDSYLFRCIQLGDHPILSKLRSLSEELTSSSYWLQKSSPCLIKSFHKLLSIESPIHNSGRFSLYTSEYEALTIKPDVRLNLGISKRTFETRHAFNSVLNSEFNSDSTVSGSDNWHYIYSDASKRSTNGIVGVGMYHSQYNIVQKVKLPPESSVFTGECLGLYIAVEYVLLLKLKKTVIFSDSMSALQSLCKYLFKTKLVSPLIIETRSLIKKCIDRGYSVIFAWLPGHRGILGNERADRLARDAIECGDKAYYKIYAHDLATLPKMYLRSSWNKLWSAPSNNKGAFYRSVQSEIPLKPWFSKLTLGKRVSCILTRMRIGHVCTSAHLSKFGIVNSDLCECGEVEDVNHIFLNCTKYDHSQLFEGLIQLLIPLPTSIQILLSSNNHIVYRLLAMFIVNNDVRI